VQEFLERPKDRSTLKATASEEAHESPLDADSLSPPGRMVQARTVSMVVDDSNSPNIEVPYYDDASSYSRSRRTALTVAGVAGANKWILMWSVRVTGSEPWALTIRRMEMQMHARRQIPVACQRTEAWCPGENSRLARSFGSKDYQDALSAPGPLVRNLHLHSDWAIPETPTERLPVQVQPLELRIIVKPMSWMREAVGRLMKHARRPQPNSGTAVWPVAVISYLFSLVPLSSPFHEG
jgi:hypothetical protein